MARDGEQHTGTLTEACGGVECFVCSYSPRGNSSRLDGCTKANFTEEKIETRDCPLGCESVAAYDRNDELLSYHRNCATSDTIMTNTCETYTNIILKREVCSCDWAYCNTASGAAPLSAARPSAVFTSLLVLGGALRARALDQAARRWEEDAAVLVPYPYSTPAASGFIAWPRTALQGAVHSLTAPAVAAGRPLTR
ncbi:hypothetical protein E2C01_040000 [Portunus trituberculatus]|uniref:Protein sleepless n=1 Tax=Portunus trituberculatus TaxID=210409 RepID=A0A5B7FPI8_PORTR|nr:hypothetical protein [Portunus trituberculatus]